MPPTTKHHQQARLPLTNQGKTKQRYKPFVPGPNPDLPDFIRTHANSYDPATDQYDVKAFDQDCTVDNAAEPKAIFDLHFYKGKKHWTAIRQYIRHYLPKKYYPEGSGLVLDCFSGSGMTGVAAIMEHRPCILVDASPAAAFISHCYTHPVDPDELQATYAQMQVEDYSADLKRRLKAITDEEIGNLQQELNWLFATKCDRCGGDATTEYVVYSERFQCPRCGEIVPFSDCPSAKVPYAVGSKAKQKIELKNRRVCPNCLKKYHEPRHDFVISTRTKKFGCVPVTISYLCQCGCKPSRAQRSHAAEKTSRSFKFFRTHDLRQLDAIEKMDIPHPYPARYMMDVEDPLKSWGVKWRAGTSNFRTVSELYTKRNLWALAAVKASADGAPLGYPIKLAITASSLILSRMCRASNTQILNGTYYLPQVSKAIRPDKSVGSKLETFTTVCQHFTQKTAVAVVNDDCRKVQFAPNSLDYVFTDPPYVGKVQYGELNFVWESWLGFDGAWLDREIVVNEFRNKTVTGWAIALREAFSVVYDALKPGRWMSICFHDTDPATWTMLQDACLDVGFTLGSVGVIDPEQKSQNQYTAEKIAKADLVVNCRKPREDEREKGTPIGASGHISGRVRDILVETLSTLGGQVREKLWDIVLKRLLRRSQMAEHRFEDILSEVATRSESGRWFLKEEFEKLSDNDLHNEEEAGRAIEQFARFRCMGVPVVLAAQLALSSRISEEKDENEVQRHIKRDLLNGEEGKAFKLGGRLKGCEFYDCLFFYLTRYLKGRAPGRTPRRNLAEFLEEYLVRFRDGDKWLYRQPTSGEAASLKKSRQSGLGRRIRQFVAFLNDEGDFPNERIPDIRTMVAWLKHCANFGLAEAGVALYEKGGLVGQLNQLSEDERYDAEDYYSQCRRHAKKEESQEETESQEEN